ncbi:hypothetical protein [Hymenobacter sp. YC55]|uniref:hypothetical protein n=1 Tax=Hymenobacter sp. YC55 TaxID=3034019 RepID=UPI0023F8B579|nr:hypothetical protein [Hymenobacter sp. YC55]MDF7812850.1 hypothetical protein [Hymenobacter sp. YC55]
MNLNSLRHLLDANDIKQIFKAIREGGDIWENKLLETSKRKFKDNYRGSNNEQCCYCRRGTDGEFSMVLDIEHILPKSKFKKLIFDEINLSVSCKRCNMNVKRERTDFVDESTIMSNYTNSNAYEIAHPNLDNYFHHITYNAQVVNNIKIIKYFIRDAKGQYTYDFFRLNELEVDSLNKAQGVIGLDNDSENITSLMQNIKDIIEKGL